VALSSSRKLSPFSVWAKLGAQRREQLWQFGCQFGELLALGVGGSWPAGWLAVVCQEQRASLLMKTKSRNVNNWPFACSLFSALCEQSKRLAACELLCDAHKQHTVCRTQSAARTQLANCERKVHAAETVCGLRVALAACKWLCKFVHLSANRARQLAQTLPI